MSNYILRSPVSQNTPTIPDGSYGIKLLSCLLKHPTKTVLTYAASGECVTGGEFVDRVEWLARRLLYHGCRQGDVVAIFSPNSIDWVLVLAATLRIGATLAAVNNLLTAGELVQQLTLSHAKYLFTVRELLSVASEAITSTRVEKLFLNEVHNGTTHLSTQQPRTEEILPLLPSWEELDVKSLDVALIMFSSGTTGQQKAVMISHRNLQAASLIYTSPTADCVGAHSLACTPFSHITAISVVLYGLDWGSSIIIMARFYLHLFLKTISDYKVEKILVVPPIATLIAKSPEVDKYKIYLKDIQCGAAPVSKELEDLIMHRFPGLQIRQVFGMTETTGMSAHIPVADVPSGKRRPGSIGVPTAYAQIKVIDPTTGAALGPNYHGEVCIRSPTVMSGYADNPEATAAAIDALGFLHTGDIGYYDDDGYLYIVDRLKELIKYNAYQVAPAELEAVLLSHPLISDTAVIGIPDPSAGELPYAWVVRKPGTTLTEQEVQHYVEGKVAPFKKLRGGVRFVATIPKTPSGKILRKDIRKATLGGKL